MRAAIQSLVEDKKAELNRLVVTGQLTESADLVTSYASAVQMFSTLETRSKYKL